jgi:hypothetical protein
VLDAEGRFATQRSPAFLDYREKAFRAVEKMLAPLIGRARVACRFEGCPLVSPVS